MGYAALRVLNEDRVVPGAGFSEHGHSDMDILTMVLSGRLRHTDTLGNEAEIAAGELQLMSAGSGIRHAEMNASDSEQAHVLQIWLIPDTTGGAPTYQQVDLPAAEATRDWTLLASGKEERPRSSSCPIQACRLPRRWRAMPPRFPLPADAGSSSTWWKASPRSRASGLLPETGCRSAKRRSANSSGRPTAARCSST